MSITLARAPPLINGDVPFHVKSFSPSHWIKHVNDIAHVLIN
jgi:hypothetical protein